MSIRKTGTPMKIDKIARDSQEYKEMWDSIERKNQMIRCQTCGKLLSKFDGNKYTIKHHSLSAIVNGGALICPQCKSVNNLRQQKSDLDAQ